jgi:hypothetical protein
VDLACRAGIDLSVLGRHVPDGTLERRLLLHLVEQQSADVAADLSLSDETLVHVLEVPWVSAQRAVCTLLRKLPVLPVGLQRAADDVHVQPGG